MRFWAAVCALATSSYAAPVQHYGYDFHVTTNNELEPLAQTAFEDARPVYVQAPAYYNPKNYRTSVPSTQRVAGILRQQSSRDPSTGNWSWGYETDNGIFFAEEGHLQRPSGRIQADNDDDDGLSPVVRGQYSYTGPDGVLYSVTYYADETGFHPSGAHLPASAL